MARPKKSRWFGKGAGLVCVSGPNEGLDQTASDGVAVLSDSTLRIACFSLLSSVSDSESTRYIYLDTSSVTSLRQHYGGGVGREDGDLGQNTPAVMRG
jgi:hypothetical protein